MVIDYLPVEQQAGTPYCVSCGEVCPLEQLGVCTRCGAYICGLNGCNSRCECEDILAEQERSR